MSTNSDAAPVETAERRRPGRAVAVAVGLTLAALVASLVGGVAFVVPVLLFSLDVESVPVLLALTAASQLGLLVVAWGYARYAGVRVPLRAPDRREAVYLVGGLVAALGVAVGLSALLVVLDVVPGSVIDQVGAGNPTLYLGLGVLSVVLVAPVEEFLFRGVVQARLRKAFGPVGAIAGASLLFGSMHLANYTGAFVSVVAGALLIACVGAVFGALYERTGNLLVPVAVHGVYNVVLTTAAFLAS